MKTWTKLLSMTVALTAVLTVFAGCSNSNNPSSSAPEKESYVVLDQDLGAENYAIGFRKGDVALGLEVQKIIDEMIADGKAAEISNKWFGSDILLKDQKFYKESEASADDTSLQKIKDKGTLILGLDDTFPPMGFRDENNNVVGFDIDLAKEVATRLGVELVIQPIDWDAQIMELNSGKVDCLWNGLSVTDERIENMFLAKPYLANKQIIIVPASSGITSKDMLEGKVVGLQKGSSALIALNADPIGAKVGEVKEYPENVSAFMDLKAGRVDVFVVDEVVGRYIISNDAEGK